MSDDNSLVNSENVNVAEDLPSSQKIKNGINIPHDAGLQNLPSWNQIMSTSIENSSHPPPSLSIPNLGSATQPQNKTSAINNPQETKNDDQVDQKYTKPLNTFRKMNEEMPEKTHTINNLENEVKELKMKCGILDKKYKTDITNLEKGYKLQLRKKEDELKQNESLVTELINEITEITKKLEERDKKIEELTAECSEYEECAKQKYEYQKNYESSIKEIEELKSASIYEENELKKNPATTFKQGEDTSLECTQGIASMSSMVQRNKDGDIDKSEFDIKARTTEDKPTEKCSENPVIKFKQGKEIMWTSNQKFSTISSRISKDGDIGKSEFAMKGKTRQDKPNKIRESTEDKLEEISEAAQESSVPVADTQGSASCDWITR